MSSLNERDLTVIIVVPGCSRKQITDREKELGMRYTNVYNNYTLRNTQSLPAIRRYSNQLMGKIGIPYRVINVFDLTKKDIYNLITWCEGDMEAIIRYTGTGEEKSISNKCRRYCEGLTISKCVEYLYAHPELIAGFTCAPWIKSIYHYMAPDIPSRICKSYLRLKYNMSINQLTNYHYANSWSPDSPQNWDRVEPAQKYKYNNEVNNNG